MALFNFQRPPGLAGNQTQQNAAPAPGPSPIAEYFDNLGKTESEKTKGEDKQADSFFSSVTKGLEKSAEKALEGAEKHVDHVLGIPSESKTESKSKGNFDDLKQIGGAALEGGKELFGHVGKGLFERLEKSSVVLGAEHALGAIPKGISGFVQEAEEAGKTAFGLSRESKTTPLGIPSFSAPQREPAPMGRAGLGEQIGALFAELAKDGIFAIRSSKGPSHEQGQGLDQTANMGSVRLMGGPRAASATG